MGLVLDCAVYYGGIERRRGEMWGCGWVVGAPESV